MHELKNDVEGPLALMERVFEAEGQLASEYPLVFRRGFGGRLVALDDEHGVRSSCAVLPRTLVMPGVHWPAGLIGSVATDSDQRGRGLASQVLAEAERWLAEQGCLFALLWAEDPRFYLARGYRPVGSELDAVVDATVAASLPSAPDIRPVVSSDASAVHRHYMTQPYRADRTVEETQALLHCPGMQVLVAERDGEVAAYACLGRGRDLPNVVHEWGGDRALVLALVRAAFLASGADHVVVMGADHTSLVFAGLAAAGAKVHRGFLGLAKPLVGSLPSFASALAAQGGGTCRVESDGKVERCRWTGPAGSVLLNPNDLLDLLAGPRGASEILERARTSTGLAAAGLPLKPFLWGLDSI